MMNMNDSAHKSKNKHTKAEQWLSEFLIRERITELLFPTRKLIGVENKIEKKCQSRIF